MGIVGALADAGKAIGSGINTFANYNARAASSANAISKEAQTAQGQFNQGSVNLANSLGSDRLAGQYDFNSAQAAMANQFTEYMWDKSASWNESMFERQMEFNAAEAQKNRDWQEMMRATAYQTAVKDMEAAGLNPILAVTGGQIQTGGGSGAQGTVSSPSMSGGSGAMASGGLLNGLAASESSYQGQQQYMGGMLGLLSAAIGGLSTAFKAMGESKDISVVVENMIPNLIEQVSNYSTEEFKKDFKDSWEKGRENQKNPNYKPNYRNGIDWNMKNKNW